MKRRNLNQPFHEGYNSPDPASSWTVDASDGVAILISRYFQRVARRRELMGLSGIQLASLIIERQLILSEDSDAIDVILNFEFGAYETN